MTIKEIFELGIKMGANADPRGVNGVRDYLARVKKEYENTKSKDKAFFDKTRLHNPYVDSGIHCGKLDTKVERVLAGIDIGSGELIYAKDSQKTDKQIDLVIGHHPIGKGLADLHAIMDMQVEIFVKAGVPVHLAEKIMEKRIKEVGRGVHPINHYRVIDLANLLKVNLMNTHTITDNLVHKYLEEYFAARKPSTLGDMVDMLLEIPEYAEAAKRGAGPELFSGSKKNKVGKYLVEMTGGTNPSDTIYKELSANGVSTVVGMHMKDPARKHASKHYLNVVIAGHMASDSLGMNLFLDRLEKEGVEVVPCSGLIRVKR